MLSPLLALLACAHPPRASLPSPVPAVAQLASLEIPGDPAFVAIARDVLAIRVALTPNLLPESGLLDDAPHVPSYAPTAVTGLVTRLDTDLAALARMPTEGLAVDRQIDRRWLQAVAEETRQRLVVERRWRHRPAEWLEPVSATLVALAELAPERPELSFALCAEIPAMVAEMQAEVTAPTARDVAAATGILEGTVTLLQSLPADPRRDAARDALSGYARGLAGLHDLPDYRVIGAEAYDWRLRHAMLLPWDAATLLAMAEAERARVDAEMAALAPRLAPLPGPTPAEEAEARALDRAGLLRLYDDAVAENLAALRAMELLTVPADLPAMHARETPEALIPLTGDGGSMNPPPIFGPARDGLWNVEHWAADWPQERRLAKVLESRHQKESGFGTYAVHEGVPGHHLQLSLARGIRNPLRTLLTDHAAIEGWALYAEELFWEGGGFGTSDRARYTVLGSYRGRIRRVFYDVQVERGVWTLQEGADWRSGTTPGPIEPEILRTIEWPTQLIGYFVGKAQIAALRDEVRARQGAAFSERAFHDALLAEGSIPLTLVRAKMLGLAVPG